MSALVYVFLYLLFICTYSYNNTCTCNLIHLHVYHTEVDLQIMVQLDRRRMYCLFINLYHNVWVEIVLFVSQMLLIFIHFFVCNIKSFNFLFTSLTNPSQLCPGSHHSLGFWHYAHIESINSRNISYKAQKSL